MEQLRTKFVSTDSRIFNRLQQVSVPVNQPLHPGSECPGLLATGLMPSLHLRAVVNQAVLAEIELAFQLFNAQGKPDDCAQRTSVA